MPPMKLFKAMSVLGNLDTCKCQVDDKTHIRQMCCRYLIPSLHTFEHRSATELALEGEAADCQGSVMSGSLQGSSSAGSCFGDEHTSSAPMAGPDQGDLLLPRQA